jgi:hypothetical protein
VSAPINLALDFGEPPCALNPPEVTGQTAQVLALIRAHGPILNVDLKLTYGVTEAAARVFQLVDMGFNIVRTRVGTKFCHGRIRHGLVAYSLGLPNWTPPAGSGN